MIPFYLEHNKSLLNIERQKKNEKQLFQNSINYLDKQFQKYKFNKKTNKIEINYDYVSI